MLQGFFSDEISKEMEMKSDNTSKKIKNNEKKGFECENNPFLLK